MLKHISFELEYWRGVEGDAEEVKSGGLTLNEPGSPDGVVQTDLISPQQPQTLKRLPLGRDYLTTGKKTHHLS